MELGKKKQIYDITPDITLWTNRRLFKGEVTGSCVYRGISGQVSINTLNWLLINSPETSQSISAHPRVMLNQNWTATRETSQSTLNLKDLVGQQLAECMACLQKSVDSRPTVNRDVNQVWTEYRSRFECQLHVSCWGYQSTLDQRRLW